MAGHRARFELAAALSIGAGNTGKGGIVFAAGDSPAGLSAGTNSPERKTVREKEKRL